MFVLVITGHDVFLLISARYPYFDRRDEYSEKFLSLAEKSNGKRPESPRTPWHSHLTNKVSFVFIFCEASVFS